MERGWFQSKRSSGLKLPMVAALVRLSRFRASRSRRSRETRSSKHWTGEARDFRLPELYCGFDRAERSAVVAYPVACIPQAWAAAAPSVTRSRMQKTPLRWP
jgi:glycogen debranching enzyme